VAYRGPDREGAVVVDRERASHSPGSTREGDGEGDDGLHVEEGGRYVEGWLEEGETSSNETLRAARAGGLISLHRRRPDFIPSGAVPEKATSHAREMSGGLFVNLPKPPLGR
jgi:hypothetical protein